MRSERASAREPVDLRTGFVDPLTTQPRYDAALTGFDAFLPLLTFFFTVFIALAVHMFITMPLALKCIGNVHPVKHFHAMFPPKFAV